MNKKTRLVGFVIFLLCVSTVIEIAAQANPDLMVSRIEIVKDRSELFVSKISVTVTNACRQSEAATSYVLVTFKQNDKKDAKAIFYIGNTVKNLKGGESFTQSFDVAEKKIGVGRHVLAEADPYKKVSEASEDNNWRTLFPDGAGVMLNQTQCSPKI